MSNIDKQALVIPQRERHDWSQAVMRNCDFCQQWALTVRHSDGGCICASCCDSEYTTALTSALVVALDELEAAEKLNAELMEKQRLIDICQGQGLEHRIAAEKRAEAAEKRIAEMQALARGVKQFSEFQICHYGATEDYAKGYIDCQNNYNKVLFSAAGKGE